MYINWYDDPQIWDTIVRMQQREESTAAMRYYLLGNLYNVSEHTIRGVLSRKGVSGLAPRQPGPEPGARLAALADLPEAPGGAEATPTGDGPEAPSAATGQEAREERNPVAELEAEIDEAIEAAKGEARLRVQMRRLSSMVQDQARFEMLLTAVRESVAAVAPPDLRVPPPAAPAGAGDPRIVVPLLSDTQVGMFVDRLEVGPRLAYDQTEFHQRFRKWERDNWRTIDEQALLGPVVSYDVWNLGDVVENLQKRPSARLNVDIQATALQATIAANTFIEHIARTRARYPHLPIHWDQLSGNHDYVEKPGDSRPYDSWAFIVGEMLRQAFRQDELVAITVHTERYAAIEYGDFKVLLTHGDGINGSALLPWYGIDRRVARWTGFHQSMFDLVCLGHFHNRADWDTSSGTRVIVNGAFFDTSAFGASLGLASPALQKTLVITAQEGIVYERDIRLRAERAAPTGFDRRVWAPREVAQVVGASAWGGVS